MGPGLALGSIREQVHDNGAALDSLVDVEQVRAGNPAVLLGLLPRGAILADTDDNIEAVVAEVETLAVALGAVADQSKSVILEEFLQYKSKQLSLHSSTYQWVKLTKSFSLGQSARSAHPSQLSSPIALN